MFSLCSTKKEVEKIQTVKYVMDNIKNARFFIELTKYINEKEFRPFGVFEIKNSKSKSFFISMVKRSFDNYFPFLSHLDEEYEDANLLLLEDDRVTRFVKVLKNDNTGDKEWAIFELFFGFEASGSSQGMTIGAQQAILSLDFLESLLHDYKINDDFNKDLANFIEYIINDLKTGNYNFAFFPYVARTHYSLSFKICGRYPPCIKILTKPKNYPVVLGNYKDIEEKVGFKKYISKYHDKIKTFDDIDLEDEKPHLLIYKIFHELLSRYIKANGLVDPMIESFSEDYNDSLYITPSKSNKLLDKLVLNMYKKCFPMPEEKCPELNSYQGKFIRLETLFRRNTHFVSGYAPNPNGSEKMIFLIVLAAEYSSKKLEIVQLKLEKEFFEFVKIYGEDFKKDIIDVMKILGILENEIDLLILYRVVKYGFID